MRIVVLVIGIATLVRPALAEDEATARARAREHYSAGTRFFDLGEYDNAIREYKLAYEAKDDPALLYNLGQAHRLAGHPADALRFYRVYLQKLPRAVNRVEVQVKIHELEKLLAQQQFLHNIPPDEPMRPAMGTARELANPGDLATQQRPETPPAQRQEPAPPQPAVAHEGPASVSGKPARSGHPGRAKQIAGVAVGVAGMALVAGGAAASGLAVADGNAITSQATMHQHFNPSLQSNGETLQALGPALMAVGALAMAGGVTLYYFGHREARAREVAVAPALAPGAAGLVARVGF
jgi:hypothetical protein